MRLQSSIVVLSLALLAQTGHAATTETTTTTSESTTTTSDSTTTTSDSTTTTSHSTTTTSATVTGETEIPLFALPQWTTADTCARSCARAIKFAYMTLLDCPSRNPASCLCVDGPEATLALRASSCVLESCTTSLTADAVSASGLIADYCSSNYATASITSSSATGSATQSAGASSQATATSGSSQATGTAASDSGKSKSSDLSGGAIAGIVVALVAGLGIGATAVWLFYSRRSKVAADANVPDPAPAYEMYQALEKPPTNEGHQIIIHSEPQQEAYELPTDWTGTELPANR